MKIKDYFIKSFGGLVTFFSNFGKGLFYAFKRFFTEYPHPTYIIIIAIVVLVSVVKYTRACSEREKYNHQCAILQQQVDSLQMKNIKYIH